MDDVILAQDAAMLPEDNVAEELQDSENLDSVILPEVTSRELQLSVVRGQCLSVTCYRGFASARTLSSISQADVYNQYSNDTGTQRDLSGAKARAAYTYMMLDGMDPEVDQRFFTEVVLNIRHPEVLTIRHIDDHFSTILINLDDISDDAEDPDISRLEGNHRLALAKGSAKVRPLEEEISFCLTVGIDKLMEAKIFRDINSQQRPMNTSHLDNIVLKLDKRGTQEAPVHVRIADQLAEDPKSPFMDIVYRGGKKSGKAGLVVSLRTLGNVVKLMTQNSGQLESLEYDIKYALIRDYWAIIAELFPKEWANENKDYLMMRSAGLLSLAMLGASLYNLLLFANRVDEAQPRLARLQKIIDWKKDGKLKGYNGLGGASIIFKKSLEPRVLLDK